MRQFIENREKMGVEFPGRQHHRLHRLAPALESGLVLTRTEGGLKVPPCSKKKRKEWARRLFMDSIVNAYIP